GLRLRPAPESQFILSNPRPDRTASGAILTVCLRPLPGPAARREPRGRICDEPCAPGTRAIRHTGQPTMRGKPMPGELHDPVPATNAARRSDYGVDRLGQRDIDGLILCAEQYAAPYDLLAAAL